MKRIPLWGQKPSIPIWAAYLLQAEMMWTLVIALALGLFLFDDEMFENTSTGAMIFTGLLLGGILGPLMRGVVRAILKAVSWFVYTNIGPPPLGYWKRL